MSDEDIGLWTSECWACAGFGVTPEGSEVDECYLCNGRGDHPDCQVCRKQTCAGHMFVLGASDA
jgi:hypothetical protein